MKHFRSWWQESAGEQVCSWLIIFLQKDFIIVRFWFVAVLVLYFNLLFMAENHLSGTLASGTFAACWAPSSHYGCNWRSVACASTWSNSLKTLGFQCIGVAWEFGKCFFFDWSEWYFWCLFAAPFIVLQFWVKNSSHSFGRDPFSKLKDWAAQNPAEFEALKVNPKKLPAQIRSQGERVRELMMEPWCEIDFCGAKASQKHVVFLEIKKSFHSKCFQNM